jgi:serine/threonine-protein kinase
MTAERLQAALADHYRIERELGRGGMAAVYLARDLRHERLVALKVVRPELAASLGSERFLHEIRMAAGLQHPHILPVFDSGDAAGQLWYTMPYVEGETLRDRLDREKQLPLDDSLRIAAQVLGALDYLHSHRVIHRDIKPENILLHGDQAVLSDLGIARAIGAVGQDRLTETGFTVGTPAYMSPEQAAADRDLDGRSDVYSMGVVLYEMLAGEPPFTGATAQAIMARRLTETPRPLRLTRDAVPPETERAIMKALARAPADRHRTAGAFAEALDQTRRRDVAAETVQSRTAPTGQGRARVSRKWLAGLAGGVIAALLLGSLLKSRSGADTELNASLLAVAPFDVLEPKLQLWREGLVDLLSRNFDGAGPLRTVSPTVVVRRWRGRADPESAGDLGRKTGAGLAIYGSLLSAGRDTVKMRVTLFDVGRGKAIGEWDLSDAADRMDRLTDSLTLRVLQELGRTRPIGSVRHIGFGSASLPAIRAFLQGEQHLRRSEWDSALGYYQRAIQIDSTFSLGLRRTSTALGWTRTGYDSLSNAYALRAGAFNHHLPPRDSLLLLSDSLLAGLFEAGPLGVRADSGWAGRLQRLFATVEDATARYPDDPEAWHMLGEALNHFGPFAGRPYEEEVQAFDRAIELDSAYAPSYLHPLEISGEWGPEAIRKYLRPYLAFRPNDVNADGYRLVARLLDSLPDARPNIPALVRGLSGHAILTAFNSFARLPDSAETGVALARVLASRSWSEVPLSRPAFTPRLLATALLDRGHLRAGYHAIPENMHSASLPIFADAAVLGAIPVDLADATFKRALSDTVPPPAAAYHWWSSRRDTASLRLSVTRAESAARSEPARWPRAAYLAGSASAYLTLAKGDTNAAIRQFLALPATCPSCYLDRLTLARLLVDRGRDQEAWPVLRGEHISKTLAPFPTTILWTLLRARVAERTGKRELAIQSYSWVAGMWRDADPELQPYVTEAREGLARLSGEGK